MTRKRRILVGLAAVALVTVAWVSMLSVLAKDQDRVLSKVTFIHYRQGHGKPADTPGKGGGDKNGDEGSYTYIARGARWKVPEEYLLNPRSGENIDGGLDALVVAAVAAAMAEWESPASYLDIYGGLKVDLDVSYANGAHRDSNTISFERFFDERIIGITTVWGYFGGPPAQREITEAHIVLNDDFVWGDADEAPALMDIQNIATHELGHVAGMGDVYKTNAVEETMYGYSEEGETKKRDLYTGDINGILALYK